MSLSARRRMFMRRRFAAALIAATGLAVLTTVTVRADAPVPAGPVVVVRPGQTLWGLGAEYAPQANRARWVFEVEQLNHLHGDLQAGQTLSLPG